jgi:hypothetical protein
MAVGVRHFVTFRPILYPIKNEDAPEIYMLRCRLT